MTLLVDSIKAAKLQQASVRWPSLSLTDRQLCDLELLLNGGFSPLTGFMDQKTYQSVCTTMRLPDGRLWPIPVTLDVSEAVAAGLSTGSTVALRDPEGVMLAALTITEKYKPDRNKEMQLVYGTTDETHPGVAYIKHRTGAWYISGKLEGIRLPTHYDFPELRHTPQELRELFAGKGWTKIVAFQTRNPMHRAHVELTMRAAKDHEANLLIHPVVGLTKPGDIDDYTRVRTYRALQNHFPAATTMISLLPLAMRMAGPREALWHAIIRKNYGVSHFIVGRDHAGPGKDKNGTSFYPPHGAQELAKLFADEIGITIAPFKHMVFVPSLDKYEAIDELPASAEYSDISGTELRARLADGRPLPEWFTYPEVAAELRATYPPRTRQGITIFFTGLSGSGKSTIANALRIKLLELGGRTITLLDGDIIRAHLSSELGFSKEHRNTNVRRIGFVAAEITKHGGVAICAPIAPYDSVRKEVRNQITASRGGFILVYVNTSLKECERRDRKGLYKKARAGEIKEFTGISDPYEVPNDADLVLDTLRYNPDELAQQVLLHLEKENYIGGSS